MKWIAALGVAVIHAGLGSAQAQSPQRPPNIVFILMDDMGVMDAGCYGSTFYETKNIDRLAQQGAKFTRAYAACPVCSPTRASILTGNYPTRTGITEFIANDGSMQPEKWSRNTKMLPASHRLALAKDQVTLATMLKTHGYATGSFGKWHLGGEGTMPTDHGFDVNAAGNQAGGAKKFGPWQNMTGFDRSYTESDHIDTVLTDRAIEFIDQNKDRPFFVYVPYFDPHTKIETRPELEQKYREKLEKREPDSPQNQFGTEGPRKVRLVQNNPAYAGMMELSDKNIGRLVDHIDSLGLGTNTIIIFTSDNGGLSTSEGSPTSNVPLRAGKGWLYEGGVREPLIVRWTDHIKPTVTDHVVTSPDFVPTLMELAGLELPKSARDGKSFAPALRGEASDRGPIFWHYPHYGNQGSRPGSSVIQGQWKLIHWIEDETWELYDIQTDPSETRNVIDDHPKVVEELRQKLEVFLSETDAKYPGPNPRYDPNKKDGRS